MINVTLDSESKELEEVMVVAYATAKKYSFTGAASTMKAGEIEKLQTSSVSRVLEGTVSGVQASAASGQPGTDAEIRIVVSALLMLPVLRCMWWTVFRSMVVSILSIPMIYLQ